MKWLIKRMDRKSNILFDSTMGISYTEGSTLSVRLLRVRLERFLLYGFVRICWVKLWSGIKGFLGGVLYILPTPVLLLAPTRAWPGWMSVEWSPAIVPDDSCILLHWCRASALRDPLLRWLRLEPLGVRYWYWCCWAIIWYTGPAQNNKP